MSTLTLTALGLLLAVVASVGFALQYIFVRIGTRDGNVEDVVWISLLCNTGILVPLALMFSDGTVSRESVTAFVAAGVAGALLSRILMFESIQHIGASRTSPIVASNVIFATLFAIVIFGDSITLLHFVGILLIVASIAYISYETSNDPESVSREPTASVITLPILAALFIGMEPIFVSIGLSFGTSILTGLAITVSTAFLGFSTYLRVLSKLPRPNLVFEPEFKWHLGAGLTTTVAMLSYFASLQSTPVIFVVPIIQTSPLFIILISVFALPNHVEKITWQLTTAAIGVVIGATFVSLYG